ncbi:uncharacterized protein J3D65DRAFT_629158 [Phyllosticta citribraziliensis]|uniref:Uncharacterized protein n=1 Tax=Phyllosticta citribraziliensis TaxID=989973 RepID=A0ABR1LJC9_9PEZI
MQETCATLFASMLHPFVAMSSAAKSFSFLFLGTHPNPRDVIRCDVAIIGGGSSGTYAAVRLQDHGKSVAIIEKNQILGGHADSYTDPESGERINLGVMEFEDQPLVHKYFRRLGVELEPLTTANIYSTSKPLDFATGKIVSGYPGYSSAVIYAALDAYLVQAEKYPYLDEGFGNIPNPVPPDLLLEFGDFVQKYSLEPAMVVIQKYTGGNGDVLRLPTMYVIKLLNAPVLKAIMNNTFLQAGASGVSSVLYDRALALLDSSASSTVLLSSTASGIRRRPTKSRRPGSDSPLISIFAQTPSGPKLILCRALLISVPPLISQLPFLELSAEEHSLFSRFSYAAYYTGLVRDARLPRNTSWSNVARDSQYAMPASPCVYGLFWTGVGDLWDVKVGSDGELETEEVTALILAAVKSIKRSEGVVDGDGQGHGTEIVALKSHAPFQMTVGVQDVEAGFYGKLMALQGRRATWWTGAAWSQQDSAAVWKYTEEQVLPDLLESLKSDEKGKMAS